MLKVFISQPMRGKTTEVINSERKNLVINLSNMGYEVINPIVQSRVCCNPVECLGDAIKQLSKADLAVFMPEWQYNRGCIIEELICDKYGIQTYKINRDELILKEVLHENVR